jgi:hypothetical protein
MRGKRYAEEFRNEAVTRAVERGHWSLRSTWPVAGREPHRLDSIG